MALVRLALTALLLAVSAAARPSADSAFSDYVLATHRRSDRHALVGAPAVVRKVALGFRLADDQGCLTAGDEGFCAVARPKPWTAAELAEIGALLEGLRARGLGPFLLRVQGNGFDTVLRETAVAHSGPDGRWHATPYPNSLHTNGQLLLADPNFDPARGERALIHLLAHAYDYGERRGDFFHPAWSHSPEFLRLTGFFVNERGMWDLSGTPPSERVLYRDLFGWVSRELLKAGALKEASARAKREAAVRGRAERFAARYRTPSFHALLNPYESFSEWCVLVHLEPDRARALNPELALWIKEKALSGGAASPSR